MKFFSKRNKAKKTCKGMTLIEVIVAMAVFSLMALVMVKICTTTLEMTRNANHVNRKVTIQAPLAEIQNKDGTLTEQVDDNMKVSVKIGGVVVDVAAAQYSTAKSVAGNDFAKTNANINLEFVEIDLSKNSGDNLWVEETTEETT